jgi:hypothetical protein
VRLQDASIGPVKPGEQDQILARRHSMKRGDVSRIDLQARFRRSLERLIGSIANVTKA